MSCRCKCGFSCDRRCGLEIMACIAAHYVRDCEHVWDGAAYESADGCMSSATCSRCGDVAIYHDMRCGP